VNAQETIAAAIEKLERLRDDSTPGPWALDICSPSIWTAGETVLGGTIADINYDQQTGDHHPKEDGELIVTLHRTISAQLAILRQAHAELEPFAGVRLPDDAVQHELDLARAILREAW